MVRTEGTYSESNNTSGNLEIIMRWDLDIIPACEFRERCALLVDPICRRSTLSLSLGFLYFFWLLLFMRIYLGLMLSFLGWRVWLLCFLFPCNVLQLLKVTKQPLNFQVCIALSKFEKVQMLLGSHCLLKRWHCNHLSLLILSCNLLDWSKLGEYLHHILIWVFKLYKIIIRYHFKCQLWL